MKKVIQSKYFLFALLSLPLIPITNMWLSAPWTEESYANLIHVTGETSVRLLVLTLFISPFKLLFPKNNFWKWMMRHRKHFGVASFMYALIHMGVYVVYQPKFMAMVSDLSQATYIFGWLAFVILLALAATSTNWAIKKMGVRSWKNLQRGVYLAAIFTALHWLFKEDGEIGPVLVHFLPLLLFECIRIYRFLMPPKVKKTTYSIVR